MTSCGMSEEGAGGLGTNIYVSFFLAQNAFTVELPDMDTPGDDEVSVHRQHWPAPNSKER